MAAIREFVKVKNGMLNIQLPEYFNYEEVEVLIIPKRDNDNLSFLDKEIEKGINSPISPKSHDEIFDKLKAKYGA